jgi:uncharacterized protein YacL
MQHVLRAFLLFVIGPVIGYFVGGASYKGALIGCGLAAFIVVIELLFDQIQLVTIVVGSVGAILGLIICRVLFAGIIRIDEPTLHHYIDAFSALIYLLFAYLGAAIAIKKKDDLDLLDKNIVVRGKNNKEMKLLDTSVLIDGRIAEIVETGFFSGRLLVPSFVLHELQMVADSADAAKRQRGRRGLDILKRMQEAPDVNVKIYDRDFPNIKEVDSKLIQLAKELGAKLATTDFNLNKVAVLQGVSVLNVNDLAKALKSVVLPGDALALYLAKEGKEKNQAVGYLDDGTMVVVDEGRRYIGRRVDAVVNSILQTSAGRMIFARFVSGHEASEIEKSIPSDPHTNPA